jgi:hypothetical protein
VHTNDSFLDTYTLSRQPGESMKGTQRIHSIVGKTDNLPTLPGIAIKLLQAVQKQEPNINEISKTLSNDVALTAKILKLVNSSFYSLSSRITTVDHAIKLLGLNKDDKDYSNLLATAKLEMAKLSFEMINELLEKNKEIEFLREQTVLDGMTSILNYKGFCESFWGGRFAVEEAASAQSILLLFSSADGARGYLR